MKRFCALPLLALLLFALILPVRAEEGFRTTLRAFVQAERSR